MHYGNHKTSNKKKIDYFLKEKQEECQSVTKVTVVKKVNYRRKHGK